MRIALFMLLLMVPNILAQANCTQDVTFECLDGDVIVTDICSTSGLVSTNATCADGTPAIIKEGEPKPENGMQGNMLIKIIYFMFFLGLLVLMWWFMKRKSEKDAAELEEIQLYDRIQPNHMPPVPTQPVPTQVDIEKEATQEEEEKQEGQNQ